MEGKPQLIYVLGGPGSGKGTQCAKLVRDYKFEHISTGDLLRAELKAGTELGQQVGVIMKEGGMVSSDIIVRLLMNKIASCGAKRFLIDGFPRNVAQAILLENKMGEIDFILNYKCDAEVLTARILHRAKTSGRQDDNPETLKARITVFLDNTIPTLRLYKTFGKVYNIDARGTVNEILAMTNNALLPTLSFIYGPPVDKQGELAHFLENRLKHDLIDMDCFFQDNGLSGAGDDKKTNFLINFLREHSKHNFILNGFPQTLRQLNIFTDYFALPANVFYLQASKDYVQHNIKCSAHCHEDACSNEKKFEGFLKEKEVILSTLRSKKLGLNVTTINLNENESFHEQVVNVVKPEVIFALPGINPELMASLLKKLSKERQYFHLDVGQIIENAIKRGTHMGKHFQESKNEGKEVPTCDKLEQLKMILFNNPNNKKFVITNFSTCLDDYRKFEKKVCPIERVITFKKVQEPIVNKILEQIPTIKEKAHEVFMKYDLDQNRKLDRQELIKMYQDLYQMFAFEADEEVDDLMDKYDIDDNNFIDENEWISFSVKKLRQQIRKENVKVQKQMEENRLNLESDQSPTSYYYQRGKLGVLCRDSLEEMDNAFSSQRQWGIVLGSVGWEGKVLKHVNANNYAKVIQYEKFREEKLKELQKVNEDKEEVTLQELMELIQKELETGDQSQDMLLEGWPYSQEQGEFPMLLDTVGVPDYILELNATKETVKSKYMLREQMDTFNEEDADEQEKLEQMWNGWQALKQAIVEKAGDKKVSTRIIEANLANSRMCKDIDSIYGKRIMLVRDFVSPEKTCSVLQSFAVRYGAIVCHVEGLMYKAGHVNGKHKKEIQNQLKMRNYYNEEHKYFPSNFTPSLVMRVVKDYITSLPYVSKNIVLFNYPSADMRADFINEGVYPRSADELYEIEQSLGPTMCLFNVASSVQEMEIDDPLEEKEEEEVVEEVKEKKSKEGEEGEEEEAPPPQEDEEEGVKKDTFNPEEFEWTTSNGNSKNLSQLFFKKKEYCLTDELEVDDCSKLPKLLDQYLGYCVMSLNDEIADPLVVQMCVE